MRTVGRPGHIVQHELREEGLRFERERLEYEQLSPDEKVRADVDKPAFTARRPGSDRQSSMEAVEVLAECAKKGCLTDPFPLVDLNPGRPRKVCA